VSYDVVHCYAIDEVRIHCFGVTHQCEVEHAVGSGTHDFVEEFEVEVLVHGKGGHCGHHLNIFVRFVVLLLEREIDKLIALVLISEVLVEKLNGPCS
jgi:hypothetical protein